ncbi:cytochrome P450 [Streptomyces sp. NPDC048527]|uniref:cytochrome P450 n=1 Tax=Streptomyces sp. NPDC048527 TaxID=3365568 RepID=UPI0037131FC4
MNGTAFEAALIDLFDPAQRTDPYPTYRRWRESAPVTRINDGLLVATGHTACDHVLRDAAFGHPDTDRDRSFISLDPPDHTRLRGHVSSAFTAQAIDKLRPRIEEVAEELVDKAAAAGRVDLIDALARPLPLVIICEMLGVPVTDRWRFADWSQALANSVGPLEVRTKAVVAADMQARREFVIYFRKLVRQRRREGGEDLLSALVATSDAGDTLTEPELLATLTLLLVAGHETTTNLIGNSVHTLLHHPEQLDALLQDRHLSGAAVDETLRYDSPVQVAARVARVETAIADVEVPAGATVILVIGAANRDPAVHSEPDTFDLHRQDSGQHLSFGRGIHYCLGAHLGKLQGRIALQALTGSSRRPRPARNPTWRTDSPSLRGLSELPIEFC